MELKAFGKYAKQADYCPHCGEDLESPQTFILFTTAPYHGSGNAWSHTATLLVDGEDYASIHVDRYDPDLDADVAYLHLHSIPREKETEETARLLSDFAKWARFEWYNLDKKNDLPTLVELIGIKTDRKRPFWYEKFTVLEDARKITVNHLDYPVTSIEL